MSLTAGRELEPVSIARDAAGRDTLTVIRQAGKTGAPISVTVTIRSLNRGIGN